MNKEIENAKEYELIFNNKLHKDKVTTTLSNGKELSIAIENPYKGFTYSSRATVVGRIRKDLRDAYIEEEFKLSQSNEIMFVNVGCGYATQSEVKDLERELRTNAYHMEGRSTTDEEKAHGVFGAGQWKVYGRRNMLAGILNVKRSYYLNMTAWGRRQTELMSSMSSFKGAVK
jgi:hypothetical protein